MADIKKTRRPQQPELSMPQKSKNWHDIERKLTNPGLGDFVGFFADPVARTLNSIGPRLEAFGRWCSGVGRPGSSCKCQTKKHCLNQIAVDFKQPCRTLKKAFNCFRKMH